MTAELAFDAELVGENCAIDSDNELAARAADGDEAAFGEIFERHKRRVARMARRYFNRPEQIEEIVQITFTRAFFALPQFRGRRENSLASWLTHIAASVALDELRRRGRRRHEANFSDLSDDEIVFLQDCACDKTAINAENELIAKDLSAKLFNALADDDAAVLRLVEADEMSVAEIAHALGWSKAKVKVRTHRARKFLREIISRFL